MKVHELITEMPLKAVSLHQSSNPGGLQKHELALVKKYIETNEYTDKLKAVPFDLYVYILDDVVAGEFGYIYPEGILPPAIWRDGTKKIHTNDIMDDASGLDMSSELFTAMFKVIRGISKKEPKSVHFILGDNHSDSDQISPTPWMIAHRLGHALFPGGLRTLYGGTSFLKKLGFGGNSKFDLYKVIEAGATMRSAKDGKLQDDELSSELVAQYLVTGKITIDHSAALREFAEYVGISDLDDINFGTKFNEQLDNVIARTQKLIDLRMEELTAGGAVVLYI